MQNPSNALYCIREDCEVIISRAKTTVEALKHVATGTSPIVFVLDARGVRKLHRALSVVCERGFESEHGAIPTITPHLVCAPVLAAGGVHRIAQWVDADGQMQLSAEANGGTAISVNISNGARWLGLDVDNETVFRGDTADGRIVWQDCGGTGLFWVFDPATQVLKQTLLAPPYIAVLAPNFPSRIGPDPA